MSERKMNFCNTELRTATVTKIKGLLIQTQQNTFVLFTLFKLTLDERKTLTKISMRKPLTTVPQTSARFCKVLFTNYAKCLKLVFSSSYAGSRLHLLSKGCALVWGMFVRGCAR